MSRLEKRRNKGKESTVAKKGFMLMLFSLMRGYLIRIFLLGVLFITLAGVVEAAPGRAVGEKRTPFRPGEELTFNLRWGVFSVGTAVLLVNESTEIDGIPAYHFTMTVRTNAFADRFYRVRDRVDAYLSKDLGRSLRYTKVQEGGNHDRDIVVTFDHRKGKVQYTNFGESQEPIEIPGRIYDPLSVFFVFRTLDLIEGAMVELPVTDGRRAVQGEGRVVARETVTVPAGQFETIMAEPDMKDVRGVFDQSDDAVLRIWLTDDARRIPVRLSSRVVVGNFHAELVQITGEERQVIPPPFPQIRRQRR